MANDVTSVLEILIKARNEASKVLDRLRKDAEKTGGAISDIGNADVSPLIKDLNLVDEVMKGVEEELKKAGLSLNDLDAQTLDSLKKEIQAALNSGSEFEQQLQRLAKGFDELVGIGARLGGAGLGAALFGKKIISDAADFSKTIAQISVVSGGAIGSLAEINAKVLELSAAFGNTKEEVATALFAAVTAGAKDAAEATTLLGVADELAKASGSSLNDTNALIIQTLKSFGLGMGQASEVADSFFVALQGGAGTLNELGGAMRLVGPLANSLGISFKDITTITQALGKGGLTGTRAMAGLRGVLESLNKPSEELSREFSRLGEGTVQTTIKNKGLLETLKTLIKITGGSRQELERLVGSQQAANVLAVLGADNFSKLTEAMGSQAAAAGAAAEAAAVVGATLGERLNTPIQQLRNVFVDLGDAIGTTILPLIELVGRLAVGFSAWVRENKALAGALGSIVVIGGALLVALGGLLAVVGAVGGGITRLLLLVTNLGGVAGILTKVLGPLSLALKALFTVLTVLAKHPILIALGVLVVIIYKVVSAINAWRKATNTLEQMQEKLIAQQQQLEASGARDVTIKSAEEVNALTAEEIKLYEEALIAKLRLLGVERALAATRGDTSTVERLNQEEKALIQTIKEVAAVDQQRIAAAKRSAAANEAVGKTYVRSAEDVQKFIDALNQTNEVNMSQLLDSLEQVHKKVVLTNSLSLIPNVDAAIAEERRYAAERIRLAQTTSRNALAVARIEFDQKKAIIDRSSDDAKVKEEKLFALVRDFSQRKISILQTELQTIKSQRDQAFQAYQTYATKVIELERRIRDTKIAGEQSIRDLQRMGMSEFEKRRDKEAELEELKSATKRALEQGDFEQAEVLAKKRQALIQQLASDALSASEGQVLSQHEVTNAVEETELANNDLLAAMQGQRGETEKSAAAQKDIFNTLSATVAALEAALTAGTAKQLEIEAHIEDTGAKAAIAELTQPTSSQHTVAADTLSVDVAIARLQQPTQSVHTVTVVQQTVAEGLASGGQIRGAGTGTSDSILAMLSDGEYVIRAAAVKHFGAGLFNALNNLRMPSNLLKGFALGGAVPSFKKSNLGGVPAFAAGGLVGDTNLGTMTFNFGPGRSVAAKMTGGDAKTLQKEFSNLSKHGVGIRRL